MNCTEEERDYLRKLVFAHSANLMDPARDYFLESRLRAVARQIGVEGIRELVALLRRKPEGSLHRTVVEAMTINETSFFRDTTPFALMEKELIPQLVQARKTEKRLRFWSAACSSGQEAHSLAILLASKFPHLAQWDVRIFGTDLSQTMVDHATSGIYSDLDVSRGLSTALRDRYATQSDAGWTLYPELRARCTYARVNLCAPLPLLPVFDGILLRNVMLYLSAEDRLHLLRAMHSHLAQDGFLILGCSEQLPPELDIFQMHVKDGAYYYRPR